jgi:hypothetical protein
MTRIAINHLVLAESEASDVSDPLEYPTLSGLDLSIDDLLVTVRDQIISRGVNGDLVPR